MGIDSDDLRRPILRFRQAVHELAGRMKGISKQHLIWRCGPDDAGRLEAREMTPQLT